MTNWQQSRWNDLLPTSVAEQQRLWERRQSIRRAIEAGALPNKLAPILGVSPARVNQIYMQALSQKEKPPIDRYFNRIIAPESQKQAKQYVSTLDVFARR